jgi:PAS domain S-box-containing protein
MTQVLLAVDNSDEESRFSDAVASGGFDWQITGPTSIREIDRLISEGSVDIIVTDFRFQNGGFAEWLFLWQHPYVVIVDWDEYDKLSDVIVDQWGAFVIRDSEFRYIHYLPLVVDKVLHTVESIRRANVTLRVTEDRYHDLVDALPDIVYSLDADGRFVFINQSVRRYGYEPVELIGKHFSVILDERCVDQVSRKSVLERYRGKVTGDENAPKLFDERRTGERRTQDLEVILKPGVGDVDTRPLYGAVISYGEVHATGFNPERDDAGELGSVGIIRDITRHKETESLLRRSLDEKETLLAEIHHRVKNNLQIISSLLNLHSGGINDPEALTRFAEAQIQIQSIALVHEHLYRTEDFKSVDVSRYVSSLCSHLFNAFAVSPSRVALEIDAESIDIPMDQAMPIALMLNELLSNSIKHAFPDDRVGTISVRLTLLEDDTIEIRVDDDGVGFPRGSGESAPIDSLGQSLVFGLAAQLGGEAYYEDGPGTVFVARFPLNQ